MAVTCLADCKLHLDTLAGSPGYDMGPPCLRLNRAKMLLFAVFADTMPPKSIVTCEPSWCRDVKETFSLRRLKAERFVEEGRVSDWQGRPGDAAFAYKVHATKNLA